MALESARLLILLISAPIRSLLFFVVDSVCMYVCLSVCHKLQVASFCFSTESSHFFGRQFFMTPSTKRCSSIFDLGPLTPKNFSANYLWHVCDDSRGNLCTQRLACGADLCCYGNEIWARRGDPVAYRLAEFYKLLSMQADVACIGFPDRADWKCGSLNYRHAVTTEIGL